MLLIGFPFAIIFAWAFEMTPDGIKREKDVDRSQSITPDTGRKLNQSVVVILAIAVGFLLFDKFFLQLEAPVDKPSIAVLPFVNMSGDAENEYFSDGLSEELLNVLAKIPQLHVAGRTSSFAFKGKNDDLRSIGRQLDVENILEGSVRRSKTRLRITAQLIDTESGYHLWSDTYDREVTDVFAVQDEISAAVVDALKVALLGDRLETDYGTENVEAYSLYLKGRYLLEHTSRENLLAAIDALDETLLLDAEYANAYILRAIAEIQLIGGWAGDGSNFIEGNERVRTYAQKALDIGPDSAEANFIQGVVAYSTDWDFVAALNFFERTLELDPGHVPAMGWYGNTLGTLGRLEILRDNIDTARELAAEEEIDWVRELILILALGRRGETEEWRSRLAAYEQEYFELNAYQFAEIYADAGYVDEAFKWLSVAANVHDPGTGIVLVDSFLDSLHSDPRWPKVLATLGHGD